MHDSQPKDRLADLDLMGIADWTPRPPVEVPEGTPHRAFFQQILHQTPAPSGATRTRRTIRPAEAWRIPEDVGGWYWQCLFLAIRTTVARHTPHLLALWDLRAAELALEPEETEAGVAPLDADAFKDLLTILFRPEVAKLGLKGVPLLRLFDVAKAAFAHCPRRLITNNRLVRTLDGGG